MGGFELELQNTYILVINKYLYETKMLIGECILISIYAVIEFRIFIRRVKKIKV